MKTIKILVCSAALSIASLGCGKADGQEFDIGCAAQAVNTAIAHQCQSQGRWGCVLEKAGVGFVAYVDCTSTRRLMRRQNRAVRRVNRTTMRVNRSLYYRGW